MDLMQKLGGRKFLMAILSVGAAIFLELHSDKGLGPTMAGFLVSIVGLFSVANYVTTARHMDSKAKGPDADGIHSKLDDIQAQVQTANSPEMTQTFVNLLNNINDGLAELKGATGQTGMAVLNLSKEITKRG
jgi:hypothetical protein